MYVNGLNTINRVEKTAKLLGVTGSVADRNKIASNLNKRFYLAISDVMEKRAEKIKAKNPEKLTHITAKEIDSQLKKLARGVVFSIERNENEKLVAQVAPKQLLGDVNSVYGHSIEFPFKAQGQTDILDENKLNILAHEIRHFFDALVNPKSSARENAFERLKNKSQHWDLYTDKVYIVHNNEKDKAKIVSQTKNHIETHFGKHKTTLRDQIDILQLFRYHLQTELNAAKDEISFPMRANYKGFKKDIKEDTELKIRIIGTDLEFNSEKIATKKGKIKGLADFKKLDYDYNYKSQYGENYYYDEKISLISDMIAQTIAKVRARQKNVLKLKQEKKALST